MWCLAAGAAQADTAPSNDTLPAISGVAQQGDQLSADPGTWSGDTPISFSYLWSDGQYVGVTVTASNSGGHNQVTSASVGPVLPPAPVNTTAPALSGTAEQGDTLKVSNGSWSNNPTAFSYAWADCSSSSGNNCSPITGATSSRYTLSAADVGSTIICVVTATGPGGSTSANSNKSAAVAAAPTPAASQPPRPR